MDRRAFLASSLVVPLAARSRAAEAHFPGKDWTIVKPEEERLDAAKLEAAVEFLKKNAGKDGVNELVIVRRGRVVWLGESSDKVHGIWSCTKSFTSTALGLLNDDKKCSLDTKAAEVVQELKALYPEVTLRHFTTMTSGYRAEGDDMPKTSYVHGPSATPFVPIEPLFKPGEKFAYWDSAMNELGLVLTRIADEPLEALLKRRIMDPIGADAKQWRWGERKAPAGVKVKVNSGSGNSGGHVQISAREFARFGHLFLNDGKWNGKQLLSKAWIEQACAAQVPAKIPDGFPKSNIPGSGCYGFNWWVNGVKSDGKRKWSGATDRTFAALGHNNNMLFVVPESQLVIVRLGQDQADRKIRDPELGEFLSRVAEAIRD